MVMLLPDFPRPRVRHKGNGALPVKAQADAVVADPTDKPREPDLPIIEDILELADRKQRDMLDQWHRGREARFAAKLEDEWLHDTMAELDKTKTEATKRRYALRWNRFKQFADQFTLDDGYSLRWMPASPVLVAWCLLSERSRGQSFSTVKQISAAVSDAHERNNLPDPTQSLMCRAALRIARRWPQAAVNGKGSEEAKLNGKSNGSKPKEAEHGE